MQERIKIFTKGAGCDFEDVEEEINEWLKDQSILEIISRMMSTSSGVDMHGVTFVNCTICIFYK